MPAVRRLLLFALETAWAQNRGNRGLYVILWALPCFEYPNNGLQCLMFQYSSREGKDYLGRGQWLPGKRAVGTWGEGESYLRRGRFHI